MPLKPRIAGDCHAAVPYEFPEVKSKTSQNFKNVLRAIGQLRCQQAAAPPCPSCDCPPCPPPEIPPEIEPVPFDGKPYENIYADTLNYIGNIGTVGGQANINYRIFDPVTGAEVAQFTTDDGDGAVWSNAQGTGAFWHIPTNTVWIAGTVSGGPASVRVYDAGIMATTRDPDAAFLFQRDYAGYNFTGPGDSQDAIEYCPLTGEVYIGMKSTSAPITTFAVLDPSNGAIIATGKPEETVGWNFDEEKVTSFMWHPAYGQMMGFLIRDEFFTIHPVTYETSELSGNIGGLIDSGSGIPQAAYAGNGYGYMVPSKYGNVFRFNDPELFIPNNGSGGPSIPTFKSGLTVDGAGGGSFVSAIPECALIVVSRGNDSLVFSDPDNAGIVDVINANDSGGVVARFKPSFNPARTAYCYSSQTLSVVPWWNQDTEWFVQFFRLPLACAGDVGPPGTDPIPPPSTPPDDPPPPVDQDPGPPEQDPGAPPPGGGAPPPDEPAPQPPPSGGAGACEHSGEGDDDGDGLIYHYNLKGECTPCAENGPSFLAGARPRNLVHCDQLPKPSASLVGLACTYQPNNGDDPYTGTVIVNVIMTARHNMTGLTLDSATGCADGTDLGTGRLVHMYIMAPGEHPTTHAPLLNQSGPGGGLGVSGSGGQFGIFDGISGAVNREQYTDLAGGKPACGGGSLPLEYDIYFRNEVVTCSTGIIVSPWVLVRVRLKYPPGWTL